VRQYALTAVSDRHYCHLAALALLDQTLPSFPWACRQTQRTMAHLLVLNWLGATFILHPLRIHPGSTAAVIVTSSWAHKEFSKDMEAGGTCMANIFSSATRLR